MNIPDICLLGGVLALRPHRGRSQSAQDCATPNSSRRGSPAHITPHHHGERGEPSPHARYTLGPPPPKWGKPGTFTGGSKDRPPPPSFLTCLCTAVLVGWDCMAFNTVVTPPREMILRALSGLRSAMAASDATPCSCTLPSSGCFRMPCTHQQSWPTPQPRSIDPLDPEKLIQLS